MTTPAAGNPNDDPEGKIFELLKQRLAPKFYIQGVPFVYGAERRKHVIEEVLKLEMQPSDVVICSYPRSGTTWHRTMLWLIMNDADVDTASKVLLRDRVIFMEKWLTDPGDKDVLEKINETRSPRIFFTHLPYNLISPQIKKCGAKVVYCLRNPKDVVTSSWYAKDVMAQQLVEMVPGFQFQFQHLITYMMSPHSDGGHLLQHVKGFWQNQNELDTCFMFYEESKRDHSAAIRKMADFCGKKLTADQVEVIRKHTEFKRMQESDEALTGIMDQSKYSFIRKGEVGDWKNHFTVAQDQIFMKFIEKELTEFEIPYSFQ